MKKRIRWVRALFAAITLLLIPITALAAPEPPIPVLDFVRSARNPQETALTLQVILILTILSLAPSILIMMTSFIRIVIVLSFVRSGLGVQQVPPNQVLIGLALFITFFVMAPVFADINKNAVQPYIREEVSTQDALHIAQRPLRDFMFRQTREKDLALFLHYAKLQNQVRTPDDVPTYVLVPAFIISELKTAFQMGFMIFIPFLVIDMIVASTLMSMGMLMLPPVMISLPFKILLFVMVDGWNLVIGSLLSSFH
ncbi:flagellar type III secretion system pore protein FliP [Thermosediminibacter litoriperuensis]|uniref:Flagellar biosynthetic protein FliP n=1 Tax=Thermosediminibacter litoriperuensis TaxID=291989 RepID=A0A5S5AYX7_9FIRM|nr:flagellar type III secretion system pore protein FliP [Thermosediminibacter litoriperuensis]TYP59915.1 flagellar biosynthetic protein FliP [Thermosediminibacter litoriperuensis]